MYVSKGSSTRQCSVISETGEIAHKIDETENYVYLFWQNPLAGTEMATSLKEIIANSYQNGY